MIERFEPTPEFMALIEEGKQVYDSVPTQTIEEQAADNIIELLAHNGYAWYELDEDSRTTVYAKLVAIISDCTQVTR